MSAKHPKLGVVSNPKPSPGPDNDGERLIRQIDHALGKDTTRVLELLHEARTAIAMGMGCVNAYIEDHLDGTPEYDRALHFHGAAAIDILKAEQNLAWAEAKIRAIRNAVHDARQSIESATSRDTLAKP
jgi:hypothetical protein